MLTGFIGRHRAALRVTAAYVAFGMLWMLLLRDYAGLLFVALSAALVYCLVEQRTASGDELEEALKEREDELRLTFENAPNAIATFDLQGRFLSANPRACSLFGYSEDELCRRTFRDITHPEDVEQSEKVLAQCACGKLSTYSFEKRYVHRDGHIIHCLVHNGIVYGPDGRPRLLVAQVEDLTGRQKAEEEVREHRERLAHVDRVSLLGEMAAGIAHEINQPLTAISNYADAARRRVLTDTADPAKLLSSLEKVSEQAQRAGEVIRRLRSLVKKRESKREVAEINDLVRDSVKFANVDARIHDISIEVELAPSLPSVYVDAVQIQQVVLNLLRNAVDATEAEHDSDRTIKARTSLVNGKCVQVSVSDSGIGVNDDAEEKLFRPFFTTKPAGMGMGLSISRSIINFHGGQLWFTRNPDRGTTFHFTLPLERETDG